MNISVDVDRFALEDATILLMAYDPDAQQVSMRILLAAQADQPYEYFEDLGDLIFQGVEHLEASLEINAISWGNRTYAGVIMAQPDHRLDSDQADGIYWELDLEHYLDGELMNSELIIRFAASHFEWTPL